MGKAAIIQVDNLTQVFRIKQSDPGVAGPLKVLVRFRYIDKLAVAGNSFQVEPRVVDSPA